MKQEGSEMKTKAKLSTQLLLAASIFGIPILTDYATSSVNSLLFWICLLAMSLLLVSGLVLWFKGDKKEVEL